MGEKTIKQVYSNNFFDLFFTSDKIDNIARIAALKAGSYIINAYKKDNDVISESVHDIKLLIDQKAEQIIIDCIKDSFPEHNILSEEEGLIFGTANYLWIIDPVDGTLNFFSNLPFFAVSIACYDIDSKNLKSSMIFSEEMGKPITAVIYNPFLEQLFYTSNREKVYMNNVKLKLLNINKLEKIILSTNFTDKNNNTTFSNQLLNQLVTKVKKIRSFGATAYDLCLAATGQVGAFVQWGTNLWDFAAGKVIAEKAGAWTRTMYLGNERWMIVAANPGIKDELSIILDEIISKTLGV